MVMPSVQVPLLSDQSLGLLRNRLLETLTGGVTLFFNPELCVSKWAYVVQVSLHQLPFFVGSVFTALVEAKMTSSVVASCLCGVTMSLVTFAIQMTALRCLKTRQQTSHKAGPAETSCEGGEKAHVQDKTKINYFDLESPDQSLESVSNRQIVAHIFPPKKCVIYYLLHPICCGLLAGYGVVYLLPSTLYSLYRQEVISYAIFVLGWLTVCVSAYSLTAHPPPETATFVVVDRWEIKSLMRPFYVGICYLVDIIFRLSYSVDMISNAVVHLVFTLLPLMWFLNILPPLDALFIWLLEQINIWLIGGSPSANRNAARLVLQLLIWSGVVAVVYLLPKPIALLLCAIVGYLMSLDLVTILRSVCCRKISVWDISEVVFFGATMMAVIFLAVVMYFLVTPNSFQIDETVIFAFGVALLILYFVGVLTTSGQCVYVFGSLLRNCFYPKDSWTKPAMSRLRHLQTLGRIRSVVMTIVAPLVIMVFITLTGNIKLEERMSPDWSFTLLHCVSIVRAFRWTWQQTESALFELTISYFVIRYTRLLHLIGCSAVVYLLMAVVVDRIYSVKSKCHMVFLLLVTSVIQEKQRRAYSCLLFVLNVVFYPVVLAVVVAAAILNAPILSLYTLPIFWVGFPRPTGFWPKQDRNVEGVSSDSIYYEEVIPNLLKALNRLFSSGVLGNVRPGDQFLLRYENRLIWLSTVESGFGYYRVVLKGLELQHTSCHAVEATSVDDILEWAFTTDGNFCRINNNPLHVYTPKCGTVVETYVDTHNVLTGVIDSPETLHLISDYFPKCLIWVLLSRVTEKRNSFESFVEDTKQVSSSGSPTKQVDFMRKENEIEEIGPFRPPTARVTSSTNYEMLVGEDDDDDPWKDEKDLLGSPLSIAEKKKPELILDDFMYFAGSEFDAPPQLPGSVDDITVKSFAQQSNLWHLQAESPQKSIRKSIDLTPDEINETCLPSLWLKSPLPPEIIYSIESEFPSSWFEFVWKRCSAKKECSPDSSPSEGAVEIYRRLVLTCHYVVNQLNVTSGKRVAPGLNPCMVNRIFHGELPWSPTSDWLTQNAGLSQLVITAFRYAFKIALDHRVVGDIESESDLINRLEQFDDYWFIGPETDPSWEQGIHQHKPNLFTLAYNSEKCVYNSHLLSRQPTAVYIGRLNRDAVHTVWTTLNLELLYLANDDEERYSIQAHSALLRNLTVQAADPPLGYPIYITESLLVKIIPTLLIFCR